MGVFGVKWFVRRGLNYFDVLLVYVIIVYSEEIVGVW